MNHFQPVCKLVHKERVGAHVRKKYDRAQTPFQRLLAAGVLHTLRERELTEQYRGLNPVQLQRQLDEGVEALWKLRERRPVLVGLAARARDEAEAARKGGTRADRSQPEQATVTASSEATVPVR
jgi:hypothetical protein